MREKGTKKVGYRLRFDQEKCTGCYACHAACLDAHHADEEEQALSFRAIRTVVREEEHFQKNVCPGCLHCGACMRVCPEGAIYRDSDSGFILVNSEKCTGCRTCETACPVGVIRFHSEGRMEKCDGCRERLREGRIPACVHTCCADAITLERI